MSRLGSPAELTAWRAELAPAAGQKRVLVCSTGCLAAGARGGGNHGRGIQQQAQ